MDETPTIQSNNGLKFPCRFFKQSKRNIKTESDPISTLRSLIISQRPEIRKIDQIKPLQARKGFLSIKTKSSNQIITNDIASQLKSPTITNHHSTQPVKSISGAEVKQIILPRTSTTIQEEFACDSCPKSFSTQRSLSMHRSQRHGLLSDRSRIRYGGGRIRVGTGSTSSNTSVTNMNLKQSYSCTYCPTQFSTTAELEVHVRSHTRVRPYACDYCDKRFFQSSHLTVHIRTHTGEKPYKCSYCNNAFNSPSNCRVHERTHLKGNEVYKCGECSIGFLHKSRLERHMKSRKHGDGCSSNTSSNSASSSIVDPSLLSLVPSLDVTPLVGGNGGPPPLISKSQLILGRNLLLINPITSK